MTSFVIAVTCVDGEYVEGSSCVVVVLVMVLMVMVDMVAVVVVAIVAA